MTPSSCLCTCAGSPLSRVALGVAVAIPVGGRLSILGTSGLPLVAFLPSFRVGILGLLSSAAFLLQELHTKVKSSFSACFGEKP